MHELAGPAGADQLHAAVVEQIGQDRGEQGHEADPPRGLEPQDEAPAADQLRRIEGRDGRQGHAEGGPQQAQGMHLGPEAQQQRIAGIEQHPGQDKDVARIEPEAQELARPAGRDDRQHAQQ